MRRKLPSLLAIMFILGLAGYLYGNGDKVIGLGLGLIISILIGLVALEPQPQRSAQPASERANPGDGPAAPAGTETARDLADIRHRLAEIAALLNKPAASGTATADDASLHRAVETLAGELAAREKEAGRYQDLLVQRDQKRLLARLASIRETAEFMRRTVLAGKMEVPEALSQMMLELEAAIGDVGLEIHEVAPGTRISELPAAAFIALSAENAPAPSQAGTVKEALSDALFIRDAEGRRAYISPAKLKLYRA